MQKNDASGIPVQWSVSWAVASKADSPLSFPFRTLADGGYPLRRSDAFLRFFTA